MIIDTPCKIHSVELHIPASTPAINVRRLFRTARLNIVVRKLGNDKPVIVWSSPVQFMVPTQVGQWAAFVCHRLEPGDDVRARLEYDKTEVPGRISTETVMAFIFTTEEDGSESPPQVPSSAA